MTSLPVCGLRHVRCGLAIAALLIGSAASARQATASRPAAATVTCWDVPQLLGGAAHHGAMPESAPSDATTVLWSFATSSPMPSSPAIVDGIAYIADGLLGAGGLRALETRTGEEIWNVEIPGQPFGSTPAVVDGTAYLGDSAGNLTAVDVSSRSVAWTTPLAESISSSPVVADGVVLVNADDVLYALDPPDGSISWSFANGGDGGYTIESSPAAVDGVVFTTSISSDGDESLWALNAATGEELWGYAPDTPGLGTPAVVDGIVYAGGAGGLVAVDAESGDELWASPIGDVFSAPAVTDEFVIAQTRDDMVAVDRASGEQRWRSDTGGSWSTPVVVDDVVYVGSNGMAFQLSVQLVDVATGAQIDRIPDLGAVNAPVVVTGGVVYAAADNGLTALGVPGTNACSAAAT